MQEQFTGSLSTMSLSELREIQTFAGQGSTYYNVSRALAAIIDNTGNGYDVVRKLGISSEAISAAEASRNCRQVSMWRRLVGRVFPSVSNMIETDRSVLVQSKQKVGSMEQLPAPCVTCTRALGKNGSGNQAVCPVGMEFANRMLTTYERVKGDFLVNLGLTYKTEREGKEVIVKGNEVELPLTNEFVVTIGDEQIKQKPYIFFSKEGNPTHDKLVSVVEDLYGIDPNSVKGLSFNRKEYAKRIGGFVVGDTILKATRSDKDAGIKDLCAVEQGIFNLCGLPYEYTGEPNLSYALQSMNLVDLTARLKNIRSPKIIDIGAGKGSLAFKLAGNLYNKSTITLVELKEENISGAERLAEVNRIPAEVISKIGDIKQMGDNFMDGNTHAVINFGKHYEKYGNNWEAIMTALENSTTLEYVLLGGFEEEDPKLSLTNEELRRLKAKGYKLAATSASIPNKGLSKSAYVFTRDI